MEITCIEDSKFGGPVTFEDWDGQMCSTQSLLRFALSIFPKCITNCLYMDSPHQSLPFPKDRNHITLVPSQEPDQKIKPLV
eukprot:812050-Amphidinium_carterae.1